MNCNANSNEREKMYDDLMQLFIAQKLKAPAAKLVPFNNYQEAVFNALNIDGKIGLKYILDMIQE